jgi:UDP-GlcNAc:undecaprenyl-phosphate/decaprenyl-phosphate GlcNAc-1-phosphate transferase
MKSYFVLFLVSLVATLFLTPLVRWFAFGWGVVDVPDEARRIHKCPTPRLGGVAIFLAFALTLAGVPLLNNLPGVCRALAESRTFVSAGAADLSPRRLR